MTFPRIADVRPVPVSSDVAVPVASRRTGRAVRGVAAVALVAAAGACSQPPAATQGQMFHDPFETRNRKIHSFNKGLDRAVVRPVAVAYTTVMPDPLEEMVGNFGRNLGTPADVVNNLLQANLKDAALNSFRFVLNTTVGVGGLLDAASAFGMPDTRTDFGETLHVWGAAEGAYQEWPVLGPSTQRDTAGMVVDLFTNPLRTVLDDPEVNYGPSARVVSRVGDRGRYADQVDGVLYDSADSYAQTRSLYLQNRRFRLGQQGTGGDLTLSDSYGDPYDDPYDQ